MDLALNNLKWLICLKIKLKIIRIGWEFLKLYDIVININNGYLKL